MEGTPIIIKRKKVGHGGHHGGAWKVAYADFVTALMALFIVLWLMNTNKQIQVAVASYFKDPVAYTHQSGGRHTGAGEYFALVKQPTPEMTELKNQLETAIQRAKGFAKLKGQIEITITPEGLRIELLDSDKGTFFEVGSANPNEACREVLQVLGDQLGKLPNKISIEGHTDSRPYVIDVSYSNWELSSDRANAARRLLRTNGVREEQVADVRGYAEQKLRRPDKPQDASNRRISIVVQARPGDVPRVVLPSSHGDAQNNDFKTPEKSRSTQ